MSGASLARARAAREAAKTALAGRPEVTGIGVARLDDGYAVKVNLREAADAIPAEILGVPVRVEVVGAIRKRTRQD
ncbi:MAG: hypothetical protein DMF78_07590 [Acidobacteria bacterium]|nr:MAG: hypothetical protein DMF78_07590 [Acidobacteriota bacterium]